MSVNKGVAGKGPVVLAESAEVAEAALEEQEGRGVHNEARGAAARKGVVLTVLGCVCWGLSGTASKFLMENYAVDPVWLVAIRQLFASFIFLAVALVRDRGCVSGLVADRPMFARLLVAAFAGTMLNSIGYLCAVDATDSGTATVLQTLSIVLVLAYVCVSKRRAPRRREVAGMALALMGTLLIATHGDFGTMHISPDGLFWGLACALGAAVMGVVGRPVLAKHGSLVVNGVQMLVVGIVLSAVVRPWENAPALDGVGMLFMAATIVVGTFCAYALYFKGVSILGAYKAGLIGTVEPLTATVASVAWLGAAFSGAELAGFAMIIITVFLTS